MIYYFWLLPFIYIPLKLLLCFWVKKYGKLSYEGFNAGGFMYDSSGEYFYSVKNAWQRRFGYCHLYEVLAPLFGIIIDNEVVKFKYDNKNWLISFWKGQYGITTGAEIGIYYTKQEIIDKNTLYVPISNREFLDMKIELYKNKERIISVYDNHWWLAAFKMGMFSRPKDLVMRATITFPNSNMLRAFLSEFIKMGYRKCDYKIDGNVFTFIFRKPYKHKVWTRSFISDSIRQYYNKKNVILYDKYLKDLFDDNDENKVFVNDFIPNVLKNGEIVNKELLWKEKNDDVSSEVLEKINKEIEYIPYTEIEKELENRDIYLNNGVFSDYKK